MSIDPVRRAELKQKAARLREDHTALLMKSDSILDAANATKRKMTKAEVAERDKIVDQLRGIRDEREKTLEILASGIDDTHGVDDLRSIAYSGDDTRRNRSVTTTQRDTGHYGHSRAEHSWIIDKLRAAQGDSQSQRRILEMDAFTRDQVASMPMEKRDLYVGANKGQEAVTPVYLANMFERARVAGAVTSSLSNLQGLPAQGRSVTIPVQTGNASVAALAQASPLNTLSETDATFDEETASVIEVGGTQDISNMVIDRGGFAVDVEIGNHLAKLVARDENERVLAAIVAAAGVSVTYTTSTPSLTDVFKKIADATQQIHAASFAPPTAIIVHPRRFAAWASELSSSDHRPLLVPNSAGPQNAIAYGSSTGEPVAEGFTGYHLMGLPIYVDSSISTSGGAGTNQDYALVCDMTASYLWRGPTMVEMDRSTLFKQSGMTVRARRYMATLATVRPNSLAKLTGSGFSQPSFA